MTHKRYPSCIMATCCVPWDEEHRFLEPAFRRTVRVALQGTPHLYVFGTAGEGYAVTDRQFDEIVAAFIEEMRQAGAEPMIGVIHLSLGTILERIQRCRDQGVTRFQISLPSWGALTYPEVQEFFDRVCGRFDDCQFMHYNLPRAKRMVTGMEYGALAKRHENLVATKNTGDSLSHIRSLLADAPQLQHFLSESGYGYGSLLGECGLLASLVINWPKLRKLFEAGRRGDAGTMTPIQREADIVVQTLLKAMPGERIDGAYDKVFARMHDQEFPLRLLPPYRGASDEEFGEFVLKLFQQLPDWIPEVLVSDSQLAAIRDVRAIDVHGHYGTYVRRGDDSDGFFSADGAEVARWAEEANIAVTIVSPLTALLPRFKGDSVRGNDEAAEVVSRMPALRQYVVIDPRVEQTYLQAEQMLGRPQCVGIKLHPEEHGYPIRDHGQAIFEFAARQRAVVLTHSSEQNCLAADFIPWLNEFPEVRLILAHIGHGWDGDLTHQVRAIQQSRHGNVFADTSSARSITPGLIEWAVREIGAERVLFGTDTPLYYAAMQRARIDHAGLPDNAKRAILRENAIRLFGAAAAE